MTCCEGRRRSASTSSTRCPAWAKLIARLLAVVDFAISRVRAGDEDHLGGLMASQELNIGPDRFIRLGQQRVWLLEADQTRAADRGAMFARRIRDHSEQRDVKYPLYLSQCPESHIHEVGREGGHGTQTEAE